MSIYGRRLRRDIFGAATAVAMLMPIGAVAETLSDALIDAYRNSNLLEQNRALLRVADDDVAVAFSSLLPTLDFITDFGATHPNDRQFNFAGQDVTPDNLNATFALQAKIDLYAGGRNKLGVEAEKETVLATREALRSLEQSVLLQAVTAYFGVLRAQAFVNLRENNVRVLQQEKQATGDRFEVGEVTRTDVALADSRSAAAVSALEAARGDYAISRENFRTAVGRYPGDLQTPANLPVTAASVGEATNVAVRTHPDIRQAQREVTVAELGMKIAKGAYLPTISATVTSLTGTDDRYDDEEHRLGITLNQPIYRGGRLAALERQAISQRNASRSNLLQTTLGIEEQVASAWANLEVSRAQIRATDLQIDAAQIAFDGTREEATLGARTTLDVLDAEQELLDARASRIDAIATQYVAAYSLLSAMGLLTVDHLNLGIQTYDPAGYYNAVKHAPARFSPRGQQLDKVLRKIGRQ
ncbi:TolC family outer membrane protein [Tropicimonas isoalkanivorans]|uniref:Outer membrane protein n=1 Tax=Tropicimonas isoalkanivorans TaxID=441112 RepID=A0A1I1FWN2_9RHOB|nr:TolC family outer membrane protein [Tropicimonas isoalkanivorans]SFC03857.1 outer membrane protein [Tropicimonas isoalkanivorans]